MRISDPDKNQRIKDTKAATKERRKDMVLKTIKIKLDRSHLSGVKLKYLNRLFAEAKWLRNHMVASDDIFGFFDKTKVVQVKVKDIFEDRELSVLSSQIRQSFIDKVQGDISNLSKSKKKGRKVGSLKFVSEVNSIPLNQFNKTYRIENQKYIFLQGFKKHFKVMGLKQIPENAELSSAELIRKGFDFFIHITTYVVPEPKEGKKTISIGGLDMGITTNITMSNGEKINFRFPETDRIKKLQRNLARKDRKGKPRRKDGKEIKQEKTTKSNSKNRFQTKNLLNHAYHKLNNQKQDAINQVVHKLRTELDIIVIQDESLKGWHSGLFGKQVQHSIMGGIKNALRSNASTTIVVDKWFPSTKKCLCCNKKNEISLDERIYRCGCDYTMDRDIHAALNLLLEVVRNPEKYIPGVPRNSKPLEIQTADIETTKLLKKVLVEHNVKFRSMKKEAPAL